VASDREEKPLTKSVFLPVALMAALDPTAYGAGDSATSSGLTEAAAKNSPCAGKDYED
jgi:hypothetical protein